MEKEVLKERLTKLVEIGLSKNKTLDFNDVNDFFAGETLTLTGIDLSLYEAADIDGASIWQKIRYIDLPTLVPTAMMVFILDCGKLLSSNTNKVLVLQTSGNIPTSDILGVYVYTVGLGSGQFSYTSAIGLVCIDLWGGGNLT